MIERKHRIESLLHQALAPIRLNVVDESHLHIGHEGAKSGGGHFSVVIEASCFDGLSLIQRHQLVYAALKDLIPHEIHALKIKAAPPSA
ncbi:MAG: BolA family protein [Candidatus Berkiellales bacterium]